MNRERFESGDVVAVRGIYMKHAVGGEMVRVREHWGTAHTELLSPDDDVEPWTSAERRETLEATESEARFALGVLEDLMDNRHIATPDGFSSAIQAANRLRAALARLDQGGDTE